GLGARRGHDHARSPNAAGNDRRGGRGLLRDVGAPGAAEEGGGEGVGGRAWELWQPQATAGADTITLWTIAPSTRNVGLSHLQRSLVMEVKLVVETGSARGRVIPLPTTVFTIGRGSKCHLRPHSLEVSKLHCAIAHWAGKVSVRDLKS